MGKKKQPKALGLLPKPKRPVSDTLGDDALKKYPAWRIRLLDKGWTFGWDKIGQDRWENKVLPKLRDFETMTWAEIMQATGGRSSGTNSHFLPLSSFTKEAQERLADLGLDDIDPLFSLRLEGKHRVYGWLDGYIFHILWFDFDHALVESQKKNT